MKDFELFKQKLIEKGLNKQQVEGKVAMTVLSVLSENEGILNMHGITKDIEELVETKKQLEEELKERLQYIDKFNKALVDGETAEGRDSLRKAQMFVNSVEIETPQNNTAFIVGLATILSGKETPMMDELKKIDNRLKKWYI